jgi:hypothetical protein
VTAPLPPINEDPAIVAGFEAKTSYQGQLAALRANRDTSDGYKAEKIAELYGQVTAQLDQLNEDFNKRRLARWEHLHTLVPTGPDIAEDTSPADRAVLLTAWSNAVEKARAAHPDELAKAYDDARRWGDDLTARAIFVVAQSEGRSRDVVQRYKADHPEVGAALAEIEDLRMPPGRGWIQKALGRGRLGQFEEPPEIQQLTQPQRSGAR